MAAVLALAASDAAGQQPSRPTSTQEETVVIETSRLPVQVLIDRRVYTLSDNLLTTFGTVSDVLSDIPSINVDPNGGITLRGDTSVLILVDGKPSALFSGANPGATLQSLPAASIDRIEVLSTPPPQFQAAGAAGIINLVTRKRRAAGNAGSARVSLGNEGRAMGGADIHRQLGRLILSGNIGLRHDLRRKLLESEMKSPLDPPTSTLATRSALVEYNRSEVRSARFDADYRFSETDSLSGGASYLGTGGPRTYNQQTTTTDVAGRTAGTAERLSQGRDPERIFDGHLSFAKRFAREGEALNVSLQRGSSHKRTGYDYAIASLAPMASRGAQFLILDERRTTTATSADYALPGSNDREWRLGYSFEQTDFGFDSTYGSGSIAGLMNGGPSGLDQFRYRDRVHAAYVSFKASIGGWNALAGVRVEDTRIDAHVATDRPSSRDHYDGAFPSLSLERPLTDESTVHFSVSRRVSRPEPQQLNPNINQEYAVIQRAGNPRLRPQYTQSYELGYSGQLARDCSYQVTGYLRRNQDSATGVANYLGDGISVSNQENLPHDDYSGIEVNTDGRLGERFSYSISADAFRAEVQSSVRGSPELRSSTGVNVKLKLSFRPTPRDSAQLSLSRADGLITSQGYARAITVVNLGYRHRLRPKLHALVTISNVFDGQRTESALSTPTFSGTLVRAVYGPILYIGLDWSSGAQSKSEPDFEYQR